MRQEVRSLSTSRVLVAQGVNDLFSDFEQGGEMWTGEGHRERRERIAFAQAFSAPPLVQVSMALWDMDSARNVRADVSAEAVTAEGFELVFRTWADTRVARVRLSWLAIGEACDDELWDVG